MITKILSNWLMAASAVAATCCFDTISGQAFIFSCMIQARYRSNLSHAIAVLSCEFKISVLATKVGEWSQSCSCQWTTHLAVINQTQPINE